MSDEKKVIVITGVSRGLGNALARNYIEMGHTVIGCGSSESSVRELQTVFLPPNRVSCVDVSKDELVRDWAFDTLEHVGAPDLLINSAGTINKSNPLWKVSAEEFNHVLAVNVCGYANVIRHFVPAMMKRGTGIIVNTSSGWGRSASSDVAPYCAAKWAVEGLTMAFAQELSPGLAAVSISPGIIHTDMLDTCFGDGAQSYQNADEWARKAAPFYLSLGPKDNGKQLVVR